MIPQEIISEIEQRTCTACAYYDEDMFYGKHCKDCLNLKTGTRSNFNPDEPGKIIDRIIGE